MSNIPEGWTKISLGKDVDYKKGRKPKEFSEPDSIDSIPYIDIKAFEKGEIRKFASIHSNIVDANSDDTLMVWDGARSGLVGNGIKGAIGSTLMRIRPLASNKKYFHNFLSFQYSNINTNTKGVGIPHVDPKVLWGIEYPIPPLKEQIRIANKLDSLLAKVETTQKHLDKIPTLLKRFRQSVLAAAVSGELTAEWRSKQKTELDIYKYNEIISYSDNELKKLPSLWGWAEFSEVATIKSNLVDPKLTPDDIHLAPNHIEPATGRILETKTIAQDGVKSAKHRFYKGQIVYSKIRPYLNKVVLVDFGGLCSADMYPIESKINSKYLLFYFLSSQFVHWTSMKQSRVVLPKINQKGLSTIPVPVPPKLEQIEIVQRVDRLFKLADKVEKQHQAAKQRTNRLTQSILAKAFRGELVPQDPNDEPASKLLKRIQELKV